jgi:tetratricopeptide (TPR) repeat protein
LFSLAIVLSSGPLPAGAASAGDKRYDQANKLFGEGKFEEAIPIFREVLVSSPKTVSVADVHTKIGDSYFSMQSYAHALAAYRLALEVQSPEKKAETQYWIGFTTFLTGRDEDAVKEFLKIPAFYSDDARWVSTAYYWAGRASERMGRKDEAAKYYRKAGGDGKSTQGRHALKRAEGVRKSTKAQAPNHK